AYSGHNDGRCIALGGTSLLWGGQLLPFTESEMSAAPLNGLSGWPLALADLAPYIDRAERIMRVNALSYEVDFENHSASCAIPFDPDLLQYRFTKWARFRHRNLWRLLRNRFESSRNIHILCHARATKLATTPSAEAIDSIIVRSRDGRSTRVRARATVLCLGT